MGRRGRQVAVLAAAAIQGADAGRGVEIDAMRHDIMQIYSKNFDSVISATQPLTVSAVLYFKSGESSHAELIDGVYNEVAKKTKKMLKIAALDCDTPNHKKQCDRAGVTGSAPHLQIYPQNPRPAFKYEGDMTEDAILKLLYKLIPSDGVTNLKTADAYSAFKNKSATKPKLILFSAKAKKSPPMWKGLATDSVFQRTVEFGFVGPEDTAVVEAANAGKKKLPAVLMIKAGKSTWFKEKELSFEKLHEWINLSSESGMGDTVRGVDGQHDAGNVEEAEYEKVREIHAKSQHELCFKQKNVCGIYLSEGKPDDKTADMINDFESKFAPKSDRGVRYSWMWLDVSVEKEFKEIIEAQEKKQAEREDRDVEPFQYPTMIFVKPPKKKREEKMLSYIRLEATSKVNSDSVGAVVERIAGGATYTRADVPKFAVRSAPKKDKKKKEEL